MILPKQYFGIILTACFFACILTAGCLANNNFFGKTAVPPEPESGIAVWISAMNNKDIHRLYALSPSVIRSNISEQEFIQANEDNLLLKPGVVFSELEILNKTSDGSKATVIEWIAMGRPGQGRIPMKFTFRLFFENGEWKVWTEPLDE